ncbi:MAG: amidophosphoribosyltransferase [Deltaproteobacteria bacterium]|nr:amidophosphoribosyltransferase [Deltaproteobacteria bacterium]
MCGFVGIISRHDCSADIVLALQALQHRGQDSAGVGTIHENDFPVARRLGLVSQGFGPDEIETLPGQIGIGHVRYPTIGSGSLRDAQPFWYRQPGVLMAHNGNFINIPKMNQTLEDQSVHLMSRCDVEPVLCIFALELMRRRNNSHTTEDAIAALEATFSQAVGAYSLVVALILDGEETLLAARDPLGIRPAVWGQSDNCTVVASESVALDALDVKLVGDVAPGEVMVFKTGHEPKRFQLKTYGSTPCIFEYIYFARPDSFHNGKSVYSVRLPYREGFIKNRYTGRTFIMPNACERNNALKLKLNPIRSEFAGRRVLLVDDSIVRGTTLKRTIQIIRDQGAKEIHLAIHSPPVIFPCYYGIDMSTQEELAAAAFLPPCEDGTNGLAGSRPTLEMQAHVENGLARRLSLDSLTYLPLAGLVKAFPETCCSACFDGEYPLKLSDQEKTWIEKDRRTCVQRELVL